MTSRRTLLKAFGMAVATPWFAPVSSSQKGDKKNGSFHRIFSCNIRVALPEDDANGVGWGARKELCTRIIKKYSPDIICMQEVLKVQMDDMKKSFPGFDGYGFDGPEMDAHTTGYHGIAKNPIMYARARYEMTGGGSYWLSETPLIGGSMSWETARARHCNWLRLKDKHSGKEFRVLNTHLDHVAQGAREKQIQTIIAESHQYAGSFPQVFAGDFNSRVTNNVMTMLKTAGWADSYATLHGEEDPGYTAHSFKGTGYAEELKARNAKGGKIDFVFSKGQVTPVKSAIVMDNENGKYPSDHYFLYADMII